MLQSMGSQGVRCHPGTEQQQQITKLMALLTFLGEIFQTIVMYAVLHKTVLFYDCFITYFYFPVVRVYGFLLLLIHIVHITILIAAHYFVTYIQHICNIQSSKLLLR